MTTIVKRAGDVKGTPDWQLDAMYETESAELWEEENRRDRNWDKMLDAVGYLNVAIEHLDKATDSLVWAKEEVNGISACEYKINSFIERYEEMVCELNQIKDQFVKGEGR